MNNGKLYLKQNVLAEPLFNQWYAWSYLISPAPASMYIANWHIKIMRSFISSPHLHISTLKNPAMIGGPFMNYGPESVEEVKALMDKTIREQAQAIKLSRAIETLDEMLMNQATGYSLEPQYQNVPDMLKGYVELVYDLSNHPSIRFIEPLLYKSPCYNEASQSIELSQTHSDDRSFALSTPRLRRNGKVRINAPFMYQGFDELFKMKSIHQPLDYIAQVLDIQEEDRESFSTFFTTEAPHETPKYAGDHVRVRYYGHACLLIESKSISILSDPLISYKCADQDPRYTYADLPEYIDYVCITHNHQDHCALETLLQLRHKAKNIIVPRNNGGTLSDPSLKLALQQVGFRNVYEIDEMETLHLDGATITGLPFLGEHADLGIRTKTAYLITLGEKSILLAADSNNIEPQLYKHIYECVRDVDVLFLGMECVGAPLTWLYGPLMTKSLNRKMDQSRRLNGSDSEKGVGIVDILRPRQVYVYAMGQEPWLNYLTTVHYTDESPQIVESNKLINECRRRGIVTERLFYQKEIFLGAN